MLRRSRRPELLAMNKGRVYPAEEREFRDPDTGARIRAVTNHPSIHHHPFYFVNAYDDKRGRPALFELVQYLREQIPGGRGRGSEVRKIEGSVVRQCRRTPELESLSGQRLDKSAVRRKAGAETRRCRIADIRGKGNAEWMATPRFLRWWRWGGVEPPSENLLPRDGRHRPLPLEEAPRPETALRGLLGGRLAGGAHRAHPEHRGTPGAGHLCGT